MAGGTCTGRTITSPLLHAAQSNWRSWGRVRRIGTSTREKEFGRAHPAAAPRLETENPGLIVDERLLQQLDLLRFQVAGDQTVRV